MGDIDLTFTAPNGEEFDVSLPLETLIEDIADQFAEQFEVKPKDISFFYQTYLLNPKQHISEYKFDSRNPIYIRLFRREIQESVFKEDEKKAKKQQNEEIPIEDSPPKSPKRSSRPSPSPPQSPKPKPKPAPAPNPAVAELTSMGFSQEQAENALEATNGNVEQAVQLLLDNPGGAPAQPYRPPAPAPSQPQDIGSLDRQLTQDQKDWCRQNSSAIPYDEVVQILLMSNGDKNMASQLLSSMH